jgi:hypothetical protein
MGLQNLLAGGHVHAAVAAPATALAARTLLFRVPSVHHEGFCTPADFAGDAFGCCDVFAHRPRFLATSRALGRFFCGEASPVET